jgi:hypothetical protein
MAKALKTITKAARKAPKKRSEKAAYPIVLECGKYLQAVKAIGAISAGLLAHANIKTADLAEEARRLAGQHAAAADEALGKLVDLSAKGGKRDVHEMTALALAFEDLIDGHGRDLNEVQIAFVESFAQAAVGYFKQAAIRSRLGGGAS